MPKVKVPCKQCLDCVRAIIEQAETWKAAEMFVADRIETLMIEHGGIRIRAIQYPDDTPEAGKPISRGDFP